MKKNYLKKVFVCGICAMVVFSSCEKLVVDSDGIIPAEQTDNYSHLTLTTRNGDSQEEPVVQSYIYILNDAGTCVEVLNTDAEGNTAATQLAAGDYKLYVVGGNNLSHFSLPSQSQADPNSLITLKEGEEMGDLLMKQVDITLEAGKTMNKDISLERKVLYIENFEVKDVPTDVSAVEATITPFYSGILLDGTYSEGQTTDCRIPLNKQEGSTVWSSAPHLLLFPSVGNPKIQLAFTTEKGKTYYTYTSPNPMEANHYFNLSGTFKSTNATFSASLKAGTWGENMAVTFEFNENNSTYLPVAGEFCNNHYVVSVNPSTRQAVLLAKKSLKYTAPANDSESAWRNALNEAIATVPLPVGISSGSWRLPTANEVEIITKDTKIVNLSNNVSISYFCENNNVLEWGYTRVTDGGFEFKHGTTKFSDQVYLRPVIDITY